ncbi:hypothetical protein AYO20_07371 [Fonsecaea nubica]|uniref:Uncharacterized protein n=1 Tax=Fonsecaea nubica TaxID=856822 RepID=A0A178CU21_9EURO|nr:hypothetical protein AYO20_07371 [Fonsecaea nubica]OAL33360.1 hypothetical protein AYO20_07371 [Fonsecaea nubica]
MSHQDIPQVDHFDINEEFLKELGQDFSYFDPCPHDFISDDLEQQCQSNLAFDSLDVPPLPTMEWLDYGAQRTDHMAQMGEDLTLQTQPTAANHDMTNEAPKAGGELETVVLKLQERIERLEKELENVQNE